MALLFAALFLADILAITLPFMAIYLWKQWQMYGGTDADTYAHWCLYGAIAAALFTLLGRFIIGPLLSRAKKGEDEPLMPEPKHRESIRRPDGSIINVEYYGKDDGEAIIFIHGLNASIKNWYYQVKYFSRQYRIITMDLAGMGRSVRPSNKDYSLQKLAADLQAVIDHSGVTNPILWGHSLGGMTILTLLAKNARLKTSPIRGAILHNTTYTNPLRTIIFRRVLTALERPVITGLCYVLIYSSPIVWIIRWLSYINGGALMMTRFLMFAGTQTAKQLDFITLLSVSTPPAVMARGCLGMFGYDVTNMLPNITVPTLILASDKDRLTQPDASAYMHDHLPNATLVTVKPANHQSLLERHEDVNAAAKEFIEGLK